MNDRIMVTHVTDMDTKPGPRVAILTDYDDGSYFITFYNHSGEVHHFSLRDDGTWEKLS